MSDDNELRQRCVDAIITSVRLKGKSSTVQQGAELAYEALSPIFKQTRTVLQERDARIAELEEALAEVKAFSESEPTSGDIDVAHGERGSREDLKAILSNHKLEDQLSDLYDIDAFFKRSTEKDK